ncbi:uncharacterized protein LOC111052192 [Nilaparvata lugens]|uniref:uncharacterized protein LOC111052192 n=1 Tax=Nilaparvata lugens TaxID=108931 RepID=UPI000B999D9C|nr:uncharacterized protein LOC111052192 [Nilaparvata lugens]
MSFDTDWDIDKYRSSFEADDHWKLKKSFILANKGKYPVERLVCLAQVFYNVEFLGCRYTENLMKLVEELSKDVEVDYREQKKKRLQRTFVAASDAAEAKAKGTKHRTEETSKRDGKQLNVVSKALRNGFTRKEEDELSPEALQTLHKMKSISGPCGSIYIIVSSDTSQYLNNLQRTSSTWKMQFFHELKQEPKDNCLIWRCVTTFGNISAITEGQVKNKTKSASCEYMMWKLQRQYYTLKVATTLTREELSARDADVQKSDVLAGAAKAEPEVMADNVGLKMMKMMGWTGGGLGKNEQGIEKPVEAAGVISRAGLGFGGKFDFKKINQVLQQFKRETDGPSELVFAKDFSNEERSQIHQAAKKYGLKSKSVGSKCNRQLFVTKDIYYNKMDPWKFMELYLSLKDKYYQKFELFPPILSDLVLTEGVTYMGLDS